MNLNVLGKEYNRLHNTPTYYIRAKTCQLPPGLFPRSARGPGYEASAKLERAMRTLSDD